MDERELQQQIQAFVRQFGLLHQDQTPCGRPVPTSQAHAIQVLGHREGITQQMLADQLNLDKSTTSRLVGQLVDQRWVTRSVNPQNRRETQLSLTPQGRRVLAEVSEAAVAKYQALWQQIPPEKRPQVLESLTLLTEALREK